MFDPFSGNPLSGGCGPSRPQPPVQSIPCSSAKQKRDADIREVNKRISGIFEKIGELDEEIENKVSKVEGKKLSSEDFTTDHKTKLESINSSGVQEPSWTTTDW